MSITVSEESRKKINLDDMGSLLSVIPASKDCWKTSSNGRKLEIVFVLGGPGSGKGTQCSNIVKQFGYTHLSVGDLLRKEIDSGSENGAMIESMMKEGKLLPSDMVVKLIKQAIEESGNNKILIDGFPRNEENRLAFEQIVKVEPKFVIFFDCSEEDLKKRLLNRNQGRADDNVETIAKRLKVFNETTLPVIDYYISKGQLRKIDGSKSIEQVSHDVTTIFTQDK